MPNTSTPVRLIAKSEANRATRQGPKSLVAFTGRKRSGKDTAAAALVRRGFIRIGFSDGIKVMTRAFLAWQGAHPAIVEAMIEGELKEIPTAYLGGKSPRRWMQLMGTEFGRDMINPDLWVNSWAEAAIQHEKVVTPDMRFANEAGAVERMRGKAVRITRPGLPETPDSAHASETEMDSLPVDLSITNDGSAEDLQMVVAMELGW